MAPGTPIEFPAAAPALVRSPLQKLRRVLDLLRAEAPTMSVHLAQSFVVIALHEGKNLGELAAIAGAKQSTISRHLLDLGDHNRKGQEGFKLVTRYYDPADYRRVYFHLSDKGRRLLATISTVMEA